MEEASSAPAARTTSGGVVGGADGSLAATATSVAVAAAASVAPFCVSSAAVGWRGLGTLGAGAGDDESDGGMTDATCEDDAMTDATDEGA